jgi:predicted permease
MTPSPTPWLDRAVRGALLLAPAAFRRAWQPDIVATVRARCLAARSRGGQRAFAVAVARELTNLVSTAIAARWGRRSRLTTAPAASPSGRLSRRSAALRDDAAHAVRRLRGGPGTSVVVVAMLGLAIGIATTMFTVVNALFLRPAPFPDADRLSVLYTFGETGGPTTVSPAVLRAWQGMTAFDDVQGMLAKTFVLQTRHGPAAPAGALVTPGLLSMLGAKPLRGRLFETGGEPAGERVVISEELWRDVFAADPAIVGRPVRVDGVSAVVIGVLPSTFRFPDWRTRVWVLADLGAASGGQPLTAIARMARDVPVADALRMATTAAHAADPNTTRWKVVADTIAGTWSPYTRNAVSMLAAGVALVFLVLCANASSLLLARFGARRQELRMCAALGAARGRLLRQALMESAALGIAGAAAGVLLADVLTGAARALLPETVLRQTLNTMTLDGRVLAAAMTVAIVATLAASLVPAWMSTRTSDPAALASGNRTSTASRSARAVTHVSLVGEIALACMLLIGATLLVRSFLNLTTIDIGLDVRGVTTIWVYLPTDRFADAASRAAASKAIADGIRALPGVRRIAWSYGSPPQEGMIAGGEWRSDQAGQPPINLMIDGYQVGADFFALYGIQLLRGRVFTSSDGTDRAVVSEGFASALWPAGDAVGRSFFWPYGDRRLEVVGVVNDIRRQTVDPRGRRPQIYLPFEPSGNVMLSMRCEPRCPTEGAIRAQLLDTVPRATIWSVTRLDDAYARDLAEPRATAAVGCAFAWIALLTASAGLFSVLSYAVGRRRREFGLRVALGAAPGRIRRLVLREAVGVAATGLAFGAAGAWLLTRTMASLQYGVSMTDPSTWLFVLGALAMTTMIAAWWPSRQAMRVDPATLLRED